MKVPMRIRMMRNGETDHDDEEKNDEDLSDKGEGAGKDESEDESKNHEDDAQGEAADEEDVDDDEEGGKDRGRGDLGAALEVCGGRLLGRGRLPDHRNKRSAARQTRPDQTQTSARTPDLDLSTQHRLVDATAPISGECTTLPSHAKLPPITRYRPSPSNRRARS